MTNKERAQLRRLHTAFNVAVKRKTGIQNPACDGDDCEICQALDAAEQRGAARGFKPTNHHNALACPYCNPDKLVLASPPQASSTEEQR